MCGLCGVLAISPAAAAPDEDLVRRMTATLVHRGPDDGGTIVDGPVALGSRRLSVIDLSAAGHMPMTSPDGRVSIVYNGEVYNFEQLAARHRLFDDGVPRRSRTDTEILLHLYLRLGTEMARELNGMFAIAIWDARARTLHLLRDRYGIKPLFYQRDEHHFRFGSEIKAIIEDGRVARRPDLQALHDFLTFDYVPGAQTAFEGIREVPPAHVLSVTGEGEQRISRYWDAVPAPDTSITERDAVERVRELLTAAVRRRLIADVPVGVFLSGGMDSSAITALMAQMSSGPVRTYAIGFRDRSFDEQEHARIVARHVGTEHRTVEITAASVRELLPRYLEFIDEPYADGSAIPTYYVSELAKGEVVVVLSGEGGDEALAGYDTHKAHLLASRARRLPPWFWRRVVAPVVNRLPVSHGKLSFEFKAKRFLGGLDLDAPRAHMWWRIVLTEAQKRGLYSADVSNALRPAPPERHFLEAWERAAGGDELARLLYIDSSVFLPDDLMIKNDRMTMAHSLEARVPFTDHELTEYLATVPTSLKLHRGRKKHLLREAMDGLLPQSILDRKKVGLEMPYSRWLRGELRDLVHEYLGAERVRASGLFRPAAIGALVAEHEQMRADHGRALWGLLNYMMWVDVRL